MPQNEGADDEVAEITLRLLNIRPKASCRRLLCTPSIDSPSARFVIFAPFRGISSVGRALQWHCRGQRFDSAMLHTRNRCQNDVFGRFRSIMVWAECGSSRQEWTGIDSICTTAVSLARLSLTTLVCPSNGSHSDPLGN